MYLVVGGFNVVGFVHGVFGLGRLLARQFAQLKNVVVVGAPARGE